MFSSSSMAVSRVRHLPGRNYIGTSINVPSKKPYFKGVVCATVASLLLIFGGFLTWLGLTDEFRGNFWLTGPLVMAVAVLLFLFAVRQFLIAKKIRRTEQRLQISQAAVAAMVTDREDEIGTVVVVMDTVNIDASPARRGSNDNSAPPDYTEATSEVYSDSVTVFPSDVIDPPPPYGPPRYDEVVAKDINSPGDTPAHGDYDLQVEYRQMGSPDSSNTNVETRESQHIQDMPNVTI